MENRFVGFIPIKMRQKYQQEDKRFYCTTEEMRKRHRVQINPEQAVVHFQ